MYSLLTYKIVKYTLVLIAIMGVLIFAVSSNFSLRGSNETHELTYKGAVLAHIHRIGNGYGSTLSQEMHKHLSSVGYNYVQLNTFGFMWDRKRTKVYFGGDPSMAAAFVETEIRNLRDMGFKVMLKPHIWMGGLDLDPDNWRSKIDFADPEKRREWFDSYTEFILAEAELAQKTGVEMLVVGTELVGMSKYTEEWRIIINKIRKVFTGKLTYAAEGMNAQKTEFWDALDYVGIDAYFPLTDKNDPTVEELTKGWSKYEPAIRALSEKYNKQIIFTEVGFKSMEGTAIKPWEWDQDGKTSQSEQALAFEATSIAFRDKPYLAGIFVWKYFTDMDSDERDNIEKGFTPYGKEAEKVISEWFGKTNREDIK